jgi:hypothetical protein
VLTLAVREVWTNGFFSFLARPLGQLIIVFSGVVLVVLAKGVVRPTPKPAFQRDDFAVGIDLAVLAIITLFTGAVAEFVSGRNALKREDLGLANNAEQYQMNLLLFAVLFTLVAAAMVFYAQRNGWCTEGEIKDWRTRELIKRRKKHPAATEADLPDAPRIRLMHGIVIPIIVGGVLLTLAVRAVVHG